MDASLHIIIIIDCFYIVLFSVYIIIITIIIYITFAYIFLCKAGDAIR